MQLKDQSAIVTGGASGLGAATARRLAAAGARVAVCDLNAKLAETVAAEIGGVAVVCDVSDAASAEAAIVEAAKAHGPGAGAGQLRRHRRRQAGDRPRRPDAARRFRQGDPGQPDRLLQHAEAGDG